MYIVIFFCLFCISCFFFFKQKTAYEMRISDWSSDVCSSDLKLGGVVEVDGAYFGGYVKPTNHKAHRRDRRLLANQSGKRQSVVVVRERDGDMLTFVGKHESDGIEAVHAVVETGATIHARPEEHTSELQSLMRISYAVFCLKKKKKQPIIK